MKKNIYISVIVIFIFIFLFIRTSSGAIEIEYCKECHGKIEPIPSYNLTKNCLSCHDTHGTRKGCCQPKIRDPEKVHEIHERAGKKVPESDDCRSCHQSPVSCTSCHNSHDNVKLVSADNSTICVDCHGELPIPGGHEDFRESISENKHNWTNCNTCHKSPYIDSLTGNYKFELAFKDLFTVPIDNSIELCKICHSSQYERLNEGIHGTSDKKCVDCHNPHTTKLSGPKWTITPKETPVNISTRIESTKGWVTEKVPILNNPVLLIIIAIIIIAMVAEYILSIHEKGMKMAYDMIKIHAEENALKTLEVKLRNQNVDTINKILQEHGVNVLGMTMKKEEGIEDIGKEDIYKYVFFVDVSKSDEKGQDDLIKNISSIIDVKSVEFTDKYEL